jgi:SAM-dependent methyltransferase
MDYNKMNKVKIGGFEYEKDDLNSYHRILSPTERLDILLYYQKHVYIDGEFEDISIIANINKDKLYSKMENDRKRVDKIFKILQEWNLIQPQPSNILDIGCGYGIFIEQWMHKGYGKGYGIEISPFVKQVSPVSNNIDIADVNFIEKITIANDISLIVAFDIIEHLFEVKDVLSIIASKIDSNILLLAELPIIPQNTDDLQFEKYKYRYPTRHLHLFTQQGIEKEFVNAGFEIVKCKLIKNNNKYLILLKKWQN